jgi:hypothetical protein
MKIVQPLPCFYFILIFRCDLSMISGCLVHSERGLRLAVGILGIASSVV